MAIVQKRCFGCTKDGHEVNAFEICNGNGMGLTVLDYGCTIQSIIVPDRNGELIDVVLGYDDIESYENGSCYYGATLGRYANRIGGGRFILAGKEYQLEKNSENGHNHIHGIFAKRVFDTAADNGDLILRRFSPDMEEGYPGNLSLEIRYRLGEDNTLEINYTATTDSVTVLNLSNHCYFNLNGQDGSTVLDHRLRLNSSFYTEYTEVFAQTGRIISVDDTPLDFRREHTFGERFNDDYPPFRVCTGYDHNMILDGDQGVLKPIGTVKSEKSGIILEAFTTEPAIQLYSGNFIHFDTVSCGKNGVRYPKNGGFCLEAQHYPDSVNHPHFPSTVLRPDEVYEQKTIYRFKTDK